MTMMVTMMTLVTVMINDGKCDDDDDAVCKVREMARAKMFGRPGNGAPTG